MGFGLLLVGYVLSFVCTAGLGSYIFAGMLLGGFLMYLGLCELRKYSPVFIYPLIVSVFIIICSFFKCGIWVNSFLSLEISFFGGALERILDFVKFGLYVIFDFTMLYSISDISLRVDYPDTRQKAFRNMIYVGIYTVFQIVMLFPFVNLLEDSDRGALMILLAIVQVIYSVVNSLLIFKCYAMICPVGQEDMPKKRSRFAFINKMQDIRDAKEEKAIEEMKNYYEEKLNKKNANRKSKNNKKKK